MRLSTIKLFDNLFSFLSLSRFRGCWDRWGLCQSFEWRCFAGGLISSGARTLCFHTWVHCPTCETLKASIFIICLGLKLKNIDCANDVGYGRWQARVIIWRLRRKVSVKKTREAIHELHIYLIIHLHKWWYWALYQLCHRVIKSTTTVCAVSSDIPNSSLYLPSICCMGYVSDITYYIIAHIAYS